jgi:hypothetical protein
MWNDRRGSARVDGRFDDDTFSLDTKRTKKLGLFTERPETVKIFEGDPGPQRQRFPKQIHTICTIGLTCRVYRIRKCPRVDHPSVES